ncbi:TPA: immunoglobulin domain-containing protein [Klebsiella variicola subsp. variicola]|nr:immunoglobulin domain-containing protein [Klebsiella variicola subsp. variicola]
MYITDLTRGFLGLDGGRSISTGTVTGPVVVVPLPPPVITQPPVAVIGQMGGAVKLTITATGATGYQWQKQDQLTNAWAPVANGANITGATTATLEISNAAAGDAGKYRCVASNKDSYTESVAVNVQVIAAPGISTQPVDTQQTAPGAPVALTVLATGNVTGYQWKRGTADAPYPSAKSSTLTIPAADVAAGAAFDWWCEVTGPGGTTATNKVKISEAVVIKLPPVITQPLRDTSAEAGSAARFMMHATGTGTLRYTWKYSAADGTGVTTIANGDQTFGTVTVKWSGADTNDLNLDAAPLALNGFKVWVEVTDDNGVTPSNKVTLTVTKPNYIALVATTGGTYSQTAEGVMVLELETGKVFNAGIRSIPAGQPPTNNNTGTASSITGSDDTIAKVAITGASILITGVAPGVMVLDIKNGTASGKLTVTIKAPVTLPAAAAPVFNPDLLDQTIENDKAFTLTFDAAPMTSFVWEEKNAQGVWVALAETTKTFTQDHQTPGTRTIRVAATNEPAGNSPTTTRSHEAVITVNKPPYLAFIQSSGGNLTQNDENGITVELTPGEVFTSLFTKIPSGQPVTDTGAGYGSTLVKTPDTAIANVVVSGGTRSITVTGVALGTTDITITSGNKDTTAKVTIVVKAPPPLSIQTQPQDVTATTGDPVEFVVTATGGSGMYNYQWRGSKTSATDHGNLISNGSIGGTGGRSIISGASEATLKFDHIYPNIYTWVHCVVTDASDATVTATSNAAKLTVNPPPAAAAPVITQQPVSTPSVGGRKAIFTVQATVTGTPALSYQWMYKDSGGTWYALNDDVNGVHVTGAKTDTLRLNDDTLSGSAILCRVINSPAGFTPAMTETDGTAIYTAT